MLHAVRPLKEKYSHTDAAKFGPLELKAVRECFVAAGHCRSHVNANVRRLVRVFRWGVSESLLDPSVAQALAMVPGLTRGRTTAPEGKKVKPVSAEIVEATLPYLSATVRAIVRVQLLTGMRPGEVLVMRPSEIDCSEEIWEFRPMEHKNAHREKERVIYIGPLAQGILRPFLLRSGDAYCFSPREATKQLMELCAASRRTPLSCGRLAIAIQLTAIAGQSTARATALFRLRVRSRN
jgi:integrase